MLVVDQFEEVFTLVQQEDERNLFLRSLYEAVVDPRGPVMVIATVPESRLLRPPAALPQLGRGLLQRPKLSFPSQWTTGAGHRTACGTAWDRP